MPVRDGSMPPMLMFRSFLTVASGVVGQWFIVAIAWWVAASFFPEYQAALAAAKESGEALSDALICQIVPNAMLFTVVAISGVMCVLLGIFIGLTAPFGRFTHTIFLAVIVGVNYLSGSMSAPPEKKFILMTYLLVFPLSILLGGYLINRKMADYDQRGKEQPEMLIDGQ